MELLPFPEGKVCTEAISWKNFVEAIDAMVYTTWKVKWGRWDYPESPGLWGSWGKEKKVLGVYI